MARFDVIVDNGSCCGPSVYDVREVRRVGSMGVTLLARDSSVDPGPREYFLAFRAISRLAFPEEPNMNTLSYEEKAFFRALGYLPPDHY